MDKYNIVFNLRKENIIYNSDGFIYDILNRHENCVSDHKSTNTNNKDDTKSNETIIFDTKKK